MAVNKVVRKTKSGSQTLIDLTSDTVTPETLVKGKTAHDKSGNAITGTMSMGSDSWVFTLKDGSTVTNATFITIPAGQVAKIESGGVILWEVTNAYTNLVPLSTDADDKTIYNGGLGYKEGYRIRSGGGEATYNATCTGFMRVKPGDYVYMSGFDALGATDSSNAINVYDSSHTNTGQIAPNGAYGVFASSYANYRWNSIVENPTGVYTWIVPPNSDIAYIRVTANTLDGSKIIIAVNEEIVL